MTTAVDALAALIERTLRDDPNRCTCDFCTGKKRHEDNWCAYCANVQLKPPKHWENMDVCDECEKKLMSERSPERIFTDEERAMLLAMIPVASSGDR